MMSSFLVELQVVCTPCELQEIFLNNYLVCTCGQLVVSSKFVFLLCNMCNENMLGECGFPWQPVNVIQNANIYICFSIFYYLTFAALSFLNGKDYFCFFGLEIVLVALMLPLSKLRKSISCFRCWLWTSWYPVGRVYLSTHFTSSIYSYIPWKSQKTGRFLTYPVGCRKGTMAWNSNPLILGKTVIFP